MLNLAIISKDASVAGKPVKDTSPVTVYAVPTDSDLVRVSPTNKADWTSPAYVWKRYGDLKDGEQYEVTTSDIEPGDVKASKASAWGFVPKITASIPVPIASDLVAGLTKVITAAKSIDARAAKGMTATLAADRKLIKDGLISLIGVDLGKLTRTININPPRSLSITVVGQTLQVSWLTPLEAFGAVSYSVSVDGNQVATQAGLTYTTATLSTGTHVVTVTATDSRGFASVAASASASIVSIPSTTTRKWFPGHYIRPKEQSFASSDIARQISMAQIIGHPLWKGVCIAVPWGQIEIAKGVYDFSRIDVDLEWCRARGLKLIIDLWQMQFFSRAPTSFPQSANSRHLPDYLYTENGGAYINADNNSGGHGVCMHFTYTRDRYKLLQAALAAHLDNDDAFACMMLTETANAYPAYTIDANVAALHDNLENIVSYCGSIWTHTPFIELMNFYTHSNSDPYHHGDTSALRMFQVMKAAKVGIGTPDMYSATPGHRYRDQGSRIHQGTWGVALQDPAHPEYGTNDYGTEVFVGQMPAAYSWEACCDYLHEDVYNLYFNTLKNNFGIWSDIGPADDFIKDQIARYYSGAALEARFLKFQFAAPGGVREYVNSRGAPSVTVPTLYT